MTPTASPRPRAVPARARSRPAPAPPTLTIFYRDHPERRAEGEANGWRVDGKRVRVVIWTDLEYGLLKQPPGDAVPYPASGVWVALRAAD